MSPDEVFKKLLDKSQRKGSIREIGEGRAVNTTESNCTVLRDGQPELHDVRFHATEGTPGSRITMIPADQSSVIYAIIDQQDTEAVILKCSEVEKVLIHVGSVKYEIDSAGHLISGANDTLKTILTDFINEVRKIIVVNGTSPNVAALDAIKQRMNNFLR